MNQQKKTGNNNRPQKPAPSVQSKDPGTPVKKVRAAPSTPTPAPAPTASTPAPKKPDWQGFTHCSNLLTYSLRKMEMQRVIPDHLLGNEGVLLEELQNVTHDIKRYERKIAEGDKSQDWNTKKIDKERRKKTATILLIPFRQRDLTIRRLRQWDNTWKEYKKQYDAGNLTQNGFAQLMSDMHDDLEKVPGEWEKLEKDTRASLR